jgi:hypothetical protein
MEGIGLALRRGYPAVDDLRQEAESELLPSPIFGGGQGSGSVRMPCQPSCLGIKESARWFSVFYDHIPREGNHLATDEQVGEEPMPRLDAGEIRQER